MQGQIKKDYHCGILSWFSFLFPELNIDVFLSVMPFGFDFSDASSCIFLCV